MEEKKPVIKYGWLRALLYMLGVLIIMFLLQPLAETILKSMETKAEKDNGESIESFGLFYALMGICIFAFTLIMRRLVDRMTFKSLGFEWKGFKDEAALGFFGAAGLLGLGSLVLCSLGYITFLSMTINTQPLLLALLIMLAVAFVEEVLFRGYLLGNLMQSMNKWLALIISAVLFALVHRTNPGITIFAVINIFLAGVFLGLNYIFTKNLWFSIGFHFAWNFLQGPVLGFEVSGLKLQSIFQQSVTGPELWTGGAFGFEGSILCPLLLGLSIMGLSYGFAKKYELRDKILNS